MDKKAVIWCEVSCAKCCRIIGFYQKNAKTISVLKRKTKNWKYCGAEGNLCPNCYEKQKQPHRKEEKS